MANYIQVFTTTASKKEAGKIADILIKEKLAACAQIIGPIESIYRWKGKTEKTKEWICLAKTKRSRFKKIEAAIKEIHLYELPEIIAVPIIEGSQEYFRWINNEIY